MTFCAQAFLFLILLSSGAAQAKMRIATYNIRNFDYDQRARRPTNKDRLFQTLSQLNPDLLAVQEINQTEVFENYIARRFHGRYGVALSRCGGSNDQRLGFMYDKELFRLISFEEDMRVVNPGSRRRGDCSVGSRPLAIGHFQIKATGERFVAISVHLKSGGQDRSIEKRFKQLNILRTVKREYRERGINNFIVMGDFNTTEYTRKGEHYRRFLDLTRKMGLFDLARSSISCSSYWWGGIDDGLEHPSLLDHILVSGNFMNGRKANEAPAHTTRALGHCAKYRCQAASSRSLGVDYEQVSDHCPILSELE